MSPPNAGLRMEQAPPLAVPLAFFLVAPISMGAAGALLLGVGANALASPWAPATIALTHLGTLGALSAGMMGALYQMSPVVAGAPVPRPRLAHAVVLLLVLGLAGLASGIGLQWRPGVLLAIWALGPAVLLFVGPVGLALTRAPAATPTARGMRLAVGTLALAATAGVWMAHGHAGMRFPGPRPLWMGAHLLLALLGWVGGLIMAVSWQVVPMFFLTAEPPAARKRALGLLLRLGLGGLLIAAIIGPEDAALGLAIGAAPAVLAVWGLHPVWTLDALRRRRRRRPDPAAWGWMGGLGVGLTLIPVGLWAVLSTGARPAILFGWLAIAGWAGLILHATLGRIVPFLAWFHYLSPLVGRADVPAARGLLPDRQAWRGLGMHAAAVASGALAIALGSDALSRATGALLLAAAAQLLTSEIRAVGSARHFAQRGLSPQPNQEAHLARAACFSVGEDAPPVGRTHAG